MRSNGEMNVTRRRRRAAGASRTTGPHREGRSRYQMDRSRRATRASRAARLYRQDGSGREVAQYRGAARASRAARTDSPRRGIASLPRSLFPAEPARLDALDLGTVSRDDEVVPVRPSSSRASDRAGSQQTPPWRGRDSNPRSPHVSVRPRTLNSRTLRRERCLLHLARMALAGDPRFVAGPEKPKVHDNNHNI